MIGIRAEDKSRWETRAPLTPDDLWHLKQHHGVSCQVERSAHRAFGEEQYRAAGAEMGDRLSCPVIVGVKEIPADKLEREKVYLCFSHTIKGQPANMPALKRLIELDSTLIDFERITDEQNRRLVFFGR
ncbi:MAG: hypothetical protein GY953_30570, partial [bacterium]|nr:hypothetical protein [bacterium]